MDIFFVISGYLITTIILKKERFSFLEFYAKRIRRILPSLITVLGTTFGVSWFILFADEFQQLGSHLFAAATFWSNITLWQEAGYFDTASESKPLLHLWSLAVEEQFYIFLPLLIIFARRYFAAICATFCFLSLATNYWSDDLSGNFYLLPTRSWELLAGSLCAVYLLKKPRYSNHFLSMLGGGLLLLPLWMSTAEMLHPSIYTTPIIIGTSLLVLSEGLFHKTIGYLNGIGKISYPLYLWHWPVLILAAIYGGGSPLTASDKLLGLGASLALAIVTYFWIENPLRFNKSKAIPWLLLFGLALIGIVGQVTYVQAGFFSRSINKGYRPKPYDWRSAFRADKCFLNITKPDEEHNQYLPGCYFEKPEKKTVFLWGDSHLASMYKGFEKHLNDDFNLLQLNASGCPPILDFSVEARPQCKGLNDFVFPKIQEIHPDLLILGGFWVKYDGKRGYTELDFGKLRDTIKLAKDHAKNVIILGELPVFGRNQAALGRSIFAVNGTNRTFEGFDKRCYDAENKIREIAEETGVKFISLLDVLCDKDGCLLSVAQDRFIPMAFDYAHLTTWGARYLIKHIKGEIVQTIIDTPTERVNN